MFADELMVNLVQIRGAAGDQAAQEQEGWVICRVFKKKNLVHHGQSSGGVTAAGSKMAAAAVPMESSPSHCSSVTVISDHANKQQAQAMLQHSASDDALDHILQYMGGGRQPDTKPALLDQQQQHHHNHHLATATTTTAACPAGGGGLYGKFMKLPPLELAGGGGMLPTPPGACEYGVADASGIADWDALDRLAAYELNGLSDASKNMAAFFDVEPSAAAAFSSSTSSVHAAAVDGDLWSLARSVSALHADLTMNNV
jgi:hypothetical protein